MLSWGSKGLAAGVMVLCFRGAMGEFIRRITACEIGYLMVSTTGEDESLPESWKCVKDVPREALSSLSLSLC